MFDSMRDWQLDRSAMVRILIGALLVAAMIFGPAAYGTATSGDRVAEELKSVDGPINVIVKLSFKPSAYHQEELGQRGVFGGIRDESVILLNVTPQAIKQLSHIYWIDKIEPLAAGS